jgi:hypothetical protein
MISKRLFFKLILQDMKKRIWCPIIIFISFFLTMEVQLMVMLENITQNQAVYGYDTLSYVKYNFFNQSNTLDLIAICVAAGVCAISGFSYLHSKTQIDTYHSMPVGRFKLFVSKYISGALMFIVPYVIHILICLCIVALRNLYSADILNRALICIGIRFAIFMIIYASSIVAVCLTGNNIIISIIGAVVLSCYSMVLDTLISSLYSNFLITYTYYGYKEIWAFSPFAMISKLYSVEYGYWDYISDVQEYNISYVSKILIGIIVYSVIAAILYQKRASENANKAIAFKWAEPVIKTMCVIPASFLCGIFFSDMVSNENAGNWYIFGMVFGYVIAALLLEVIFRNDIKGVFRHKKQFVFNGICTALIFIIFKYDVLGYNTYIPNDEQIQSCAVSLGLFTSYSMNVLPDGEYWYTDSISYSMHNMELTDNQSVMELARKASKDKLSGNGYQPIVIGYKLVNGKIVYRKYCVDISDEETLKLISDIFNDYNYKLGSASVLNESLDAEYQNVRCHGRYISKSIDLTDSLQSKLLEAYRTDYMKLTFDTVINTCPVGEIELTGGEVHMKNMNGYRNSTTGTLIIYPQFTNTIEIMKENGFDFNYVLNVDEVRNMSAAYLEVDKNSGYTYNRSDLKQIIDREQIQEILDNIIYCEAYWSDNLYMDNFIESEDEDHFTIYIETYDDIGIDMGFYFKKGCVPEFMNNLKN